MPKASNRTSVRKAKSEATATGDAPFKLALAAPRPLREVLDEHLAAMGFVRRGCDVYPNDPTVAELSDLLNDTSMCSINVLWETTIAPAIIDGGLSLWACGDSLLSDLREYRLSPFLKDYCIVDLERGILEFGQAGKQDVLYDFHVGAPSSKALEPPQAEGPPSKRRGRKPSEWDPFMEALILDLIGPRLPKTNEALVGLLVDRGRDKPGFISTTSACKYITSHWDFISEACANSRYRRP